MSNLPDLDNLQVPLDLPFPAATKQVAGVVNGIKTDVTCIQFSDKILVTVSQNGRLGHWLHVPLENKNPGEQGFHTFSEPADDDLLPMSRLMATSLLGGRAPGHETIGQLYARQIASAIATKTPDEKRLLVVGLGLESVEADREVFFAIIDLVLQCI
jgi:proteasome assembly chaperone 3